MIIVFFDVKSQRRYCCKYQVLPAALLIILIYNQIGTWSFAYLTPNEVSAS